MANETTGVIHTTPTREAQADTIKEAIKLKASAIAIGNGGSSVGVALRNAGYPVFFANTSFRDLDASVVPNSENAFLFEDVNKQSRGAGRDRSIAKEIYKAWSAEGGMFKQELFTTMLRESDIIFVIASTAGGTGSGLAPTIAYQVAVKFPNKIVIPIAILPRDAESVKSQYNTIDYFNEIDSLNKSGQASFSYMAYDLQNLSYMTADESYKKVASDVVDAVGVITGSMSEITKHGMIDERDMLTIISTPGLMTIVTDKQIDLNDVDAKGLQSMMADKIKKGSTCQIQKDKICKYYGSFIKIQEESHDDVVKNDYGTLNEVTGKPLDIFVNYATTDGSFASYGMIISGQSLPFDRINRCADVVKAYQENLKQKEYSLNQDMAKIKELSKNAQRSKLMGCASNAVTEDINAGDDIPDFLA
jgi:cell division GTPase FtsZ